jgi:4-amino-4-deoxy-L-arabinose transferase-like glycosyltransferase
VSSAPQTAAPPPSTPNPAASAPPHPGRRRERLLGARPHLRHLALAGVLALSALLNVYKLSQNSYANIFYSAGVKSMLRSLHNFLFVSFDPGGLVTVDKPPLALWLQAASAKLFGFSPLSLLLPEAIAGVLAVALLYHLLARRFGTIAALAGALAMAVFPSLVAVSRANGVDPLLILLMLLACAAGLRATETGRWKALLCCALFVGLAFNTKTLAALLVVPGIALAYLLCAPGSVLRRLTQLLLAGLAMALLAFSWIAFVELTPASKRPFVGSSTNNSELGLTFEYNGFGRVEGQVGGPGQITVRPGASVALSHRAHARRSGANVALSHRAHAGRPHPAAPHRLHAAKTPAASASSRGRPQSPPTPTPTPAPARTARTREKYPIPFGASPGPLRLLRKGLGDQGGWILPLALFGLIGAALLLALERRASADSAGRRDPRLATIIVLGGWFLVEALVLSTSKGIVHPYYVSALAPGTGAMAGVGADAFLQLARGARRAWALALVPLAVLATVAAQLVLMHREHYMVWFEPALMIGAAIAVCALIALRRLATPSIVLVFLLLLVVPTGYSSSTWLAPVESTFPAAGPRQAAGTGGYGIDGRDLAIDRALARYVSTHRPGSRWALLTVASETAAPFILQGLDAAAVGGYGGTDPALDGRGLGRLVAAGQARYVLLGGEFSERGGNRATQAVLRACRQLDPDTWNSPVPYPYGLTLFDCAGHERALAS